MSNISVIRLIAEKMANTKPGRIYCHDFVALEISIQELCFPLKTYRTRPVYREIKHLKMSNQLPLKL